MWFLWFSRWRPPPFWISKSGNFNGRSAVGGQCASTCQSSSKSVKRLEIYGDLTVFKMAAVRHLGFVKFKLFNGREVKRPILHQRTKFRRDRSNHCGDIAILWFFKVAAAAILDFQKFKILTVDPVQWSNVRHVAKFHQDRSNGRRYRPMVI